MTMHNEMIWKLAYRAFEFIMIIWAISAMVGCSTLTPTLAQTPTATEIIISTKTSVPSPTPYVGPNILFYIQDNNRLFSVSADGSNQREIAQGGQFSISPDHQKLVYRTAETYGSNNDEVIVMDLLQGKIIFSWNVPGYCEGIFRLSRFDWSPDSQRIAFTLTRHDGVGPVPNCELQYHYEDMGIYQIDLASAIITHPPLADIFLDYLNTAALYSPDGSKLRLGPRGETFDIKTWARIDLEPFYDLVQLCDQPEKIGICNDSNLCLYGQDNQIVKYLTEYRAHPELSEQSYEFIDTFKLFSDCSSVVYETQRIWMPPLTPEPNNELVFLMKTLYVMSVNGANDQVIGTNVWEYFLSPDNRKIVFYEQDRFIEEANISVVNSDGSNNHHIAEFLKRRATIYGPLMVVSPTGEKVAFVNREGIAIVDLDGNNLVQVVNLPDNAPTDKISLEILDWH